MTRASVLLNQQRRVRFQRAELEAFLADLEAKVVAKVVRYNELVVLVVTDAVIRRYNRRFRGIDKSTDVLSFHPSDIMVSAETAQRQGRRFGHSVETELKILVLHGALHLLGYDHERDRGEMAKLERRWRRRLGLPQALTERSLTERDT